ncbi:MAG: hypothetical protein J7619_08515 [Dyadobacter sp.]|uniref:hypothetical protein n=1 Tax=Dyadobacter sp. TaxID=1914288 RepID=UPI001B07E33B|nr:hypothetical protein [Dyadobacter sp.]MBO9612721.1 hypothetical protein [Dyadobacter sp.]
MIHRIECCYQYYIATRFFVSNTFSQWSQWRNGAKVHLRADYSQASGRAGMQCRVEGSTLPHARPEACE